MKTATVTIPTARSHRGVTTGQPDGATEATEWVSWLRFFAIAGVVTIHTVGSTAAMPDARGNLTGLLAVVLDIGAIFTVPVFVMISGALLLDPSKFTNGGDFLRKRALRLIPAIIFWHLFYWGFRVFYLDHHLSPLGAVQNAMRGKMFQALYFFWIALGLAVVAPVLIPWIASVSRRTVLIGGSLAAAMPILTISTSGFRNAQVVWVETAWTWWIFYIGLFLLGWGLRGVRLRGPLLAGALVATVALGALLCWQWRNSEVPPWIGILSPVSYFGFTVHLYSILVFMVAQSIVRPDGMLRGLTGPRAHGLGRTLGDATMGVFALHPALVVLVLKVPFVGGEPIATSPWHLVARVLAVLVVTYAVVLLLRRVPVIRRVL